MKGIRMFLILPQLALLFLTEGWDDLTSEGHGYA